MQLRMATWQARTAAPTYVRVIRCNNSIRAVPRALSAQARSSTQHAATCWAGGARPAAPATPASRHRQQRSTAVRAASLDLPMTEGPYSGQPDLLLEHQGSGLRVAVFGVEHMGVQPHIGADNGAPPCPVPPGLSLHPYTSARAHSCRYLRRHGNCQPLHCSVGCRSTDVCRAMERQAQRLSSACDGARICARPCMHTDLAVDAALRNGLQASTSCRPLPKQ